MRYFPQTASARQNPFPIPRPIDKQRLMELCSTAATTYSRGWNNGTAGNFSIRGDAGIIWQSPSGVPKGQMHPRQFIPINSADLSKVSPNSGKPSDELPLHAAIYRRFSNANIILHTHPPALVQATLGQDQLAFTNQEMTKVFGRNTHEGTLKIPIIANTQDMLGLGVSLTNRLMEHPVVILEGHGVYAWGQECYDALKILEGLEFLCQTNL